MLARAAQTIEASMAKRREQFGVLADAANAAFAASGDASDHAAMIRKICASEINLRANMLVDAVLAGHQATSETSADRVRRAAKDWVERHFVLLNISKTNEPPTMSIEAGRAIATSSAQIDAAFDALKHDYVERAMRIVPRFAARIREMVSGCISE